MRGAIAAVLLGLVSAVGAADAPRMRLDPPPGWSDVTARLSTPGVLLAFSGPGASSFVVAQAPAPPLDDAVAVRGFLESALDGLRRGSRLDYRARGRVEERTLRNGLAAQLLRADLDGRPRLVVAVFQAAGRPLLATLSSSAPEAMLDPLLGALRVEAQAPRERGTARSLDGQLEISLGGGLRSRALTGEEAARGVVLVVQDAGAEAVFLKLREAAAAPSRQAALARAAVADALGVPLDAVSPAAAAATPAGPEAVYAWAPVPYASGRLAAGFLPWGYWGYSVLVRGPQADDVLVGVLAALKQGPAASPGLVAVSPRIEVAGGRRRLYAAILVALLVLAVAAAWRIRSGKDKDRGV